MGKATRQKQETLANSEAELQEKFATRTKELEEKLAEPAPPVAEDFNEYEGFFIRNKESFSLRTKSKNRDKQRLEFVRHAFHLFPVPDFMFEAWESPQPNKTYGNGTRYWLGPSYGFCAEEGYRLWYICIATGGSFYKEYGHYWFTKKESHIFLNCKHDISINEAIIYAVAYAESNNMGRSLRIAKSKISDFSELTPFWKEVVRFFAQQDIKSKEIVDDIVDYIVYQQRENPDFTIIGKGHTLKSLLAKVETWHQDLRRLQLIGESNWEGIPLKDREYTQKNRDGSTSTWKFTQIKSAKALQLEGNAMRHCVLGYKRQCIANECSIWSLTLNDNRKLTIEVRDRAIVQTRGLANRVARPDEKSVVKKWATDSGLFYKI
jgi:hypothetical protein